MMKPAAIATSLVLSLATAFSATTVRFSEVCSVDAPDSKSFTSANNETLQVENESLLTEQDIESAFAFSDSQGWTVAINLLPNGAKNFDDALPGLHQKRLAIIVNGKLVSAPTILLKHANGRLQISGRFSELEARQIASDLNQNALKRGSSVARPRPSEGDPRFTATPYEVIKSPKPKAPAK